MFFATFKLDDKTRVVDMGGLPGTWLAQPGNFPVVQVNLNPHPTQSARFTLIKGDATHLPFQDQCFDIVFSNSVIEHLGNWENQQAFAREALRVAPRVWIQTPARLFPIEPHLLAPLVHYFPKSIQRKLLRWCTVWGWLNKPNSQQVDAFLAEVRLLSYAEMKSLFPGCQIIKERFFGLTKSYIAVKV